MKTPGSNKVDQGAKPIPPAGSLGLLAYGYRGLLAWRQARDEYLQQKQNDQSQEKDK